MQPEYTTRFYDYMSGSQAAYATKALQALGTFYKPKSVVDVGCGIGGWTASSGKVFNIAGENLLGIDGKFVNVDQLVIPATSFRSADLEDPLKFDRRYDLTICCEVAEHVSAERAPSFVADLVSAADVILFSAAAPFQGGTHHVNEQWPEYWGILFRKHGYVCYDVIRDQIWHDDDIAWYYRQNLMVFAKREVGDKIFGASNAADKKPITRIHPYMFLTMIAKVWPNMYGTAWATECAHWRIISEAYLAGATELPETPVLKNALVSYWGEFTRDDIEAMHRSGPTNPRIYMENPVTIQDDKIVQYTGAIPSAGTKLPEPLRKIAKAFRT